MTDAEKADLIASASQAAETMIAAFDAEDASYQDYYAHWAEYPAAAYPRLPDLLDRIQASWWDRYEDRTTVMGEVNGIVVGPHAVALERIDVSTATNAEGVRLEQRWVERQLWSNESGEWRILFEAFQMLGTREFQ